MILVRQLVQSSGMRVPLFTVVIYSITVLRCLIQCCDVSVSNLNPFIGSLNLHVAQYTKDPITAVF